MPTESKHPTYSPPEYFPAYCKWLFYGGDSLVRTVQLVQAVSGGVERMIHFGALLNAFTTEEIITFRRMSREGSGQYALVRMLDQIHDHVPDHMSPDYRVRK